MTQHEILLTQIRNSEQKFQQNDYLGTDLCACTVERFGSFPVLLSAPHAIKQIRNGQIKAQEFYTGAIVECLAQKLGCACITKQSLCVSATNDDPNTDNENCAYKTAVRQFVQSHKIELFVDIHGLAAKRDSIVDICIDNGRNVNDSAAVLALQQCLEDTFGVNACSVDKYFAAAPVNVMSKWVHSAFNISALELEINGAYRWFADTTARQSLDLFLCLEKWLKQCNFHGL